MEDSKEKLLKAIRHYQDSLERHTKTGHSDKLMHALERLSKLPIKVCHLEETGVGRTVNGLKKVEGKVGENARNLVDKWKSMVKGEDDAEQERIEKKEKPSEQLKENVDDAIDEDPDPQTLQICDEDVQNDREKASNVERELSSHKKSSKDNNIHNSDRHKSHKKRSRSRDRHDRKSKHSHSSEQSDQDSSDSDSDTKHKSKKLKDDRDSHKISSHKSSRHSSNSESSSESESDDSESERESPPRHKKSRKYERSSSRSSDRSSSDSEHSSDESSSRGSKNNKYSDRKSKKSHSSDSSDSNSDTEYRKKHNKLTEKNGTNKEKETSKKDSKSNSESDRDSKDKYNKSRDSHYESKDKNSKTKGKTHDSKDRSQSKENKHEKRDKEKESISRKESLNSKIKTKHEESEKHKKNSKDLEKTKNKSDSDRESKKSGKNDKYKESNGNLDSRKGSKSHKEKESSSKGSSDKKREKEPSADRETKKHKGSSDIKESKSKSHGSSSSSKSKDKEIDKNKKEKERDKKDKTESGKSMKENSSGSSSSKGTKEKDIEKNKTHATTPLSSSKSKMPPKKLPIVNGIDSESGASFADVLGMLAAPVFSKSKKKSQDKNVSEKISEKGEKALKNSPSTSTGKSSSSKETAEVPKLLKDPPVELEPLDINMASLLPSITPNYRPLSLPLDDQPKRMWSDDEALSRVITAKHQRTKVYSGNKTGYTKVPSLFDLCTRILQDNIDALEYTGGVPYSILKPIIEKATPDQLYQLEFHNPYLIEDSDELWLLHCQREFKTKKREEMESWRDMYMRCLDEREAKLKALTANIKQSQDEKIPVRTTKLAYLDSVVKPPRNIARRQAKNGTAVDIKKPSHTPSERLNQLAKSGEASKVAVPNPGRAAAERSSTSHSSSSHIKPKKAPLMAKALSILKNRFGRR